MDTIGDRLKAARERQGWSTRRLEAELRDLEEEPGELQPSSVSQFENNKRTPRTPYVAAVSKLLDANPRWLLLGEGPATLTEARESAYEEGLRYATERMEEVIKELAAASRLREAAEAVEGGGTEGADDDSSGEGTEEGDAGDGT